MTLDNYFIRKVIRSIMMQNFIENEVILVIIDSIGFIFSKDFYVIDVILKDRQNTYYVINNVAKELVEEEDFHIKTIKEKLY